MPHYFSGKQPKRYAERIIVFSHRGIKLTLRSASNIFSKEEVDPGTKLLLDYITVPSSGNVLDLGTGIGIIGIYLAKANPSLTVYMTDTNPIAIKIARVNAKLNNVSDRTVILQTNLYEGFEHGFFNAIYTNPPISAGWDVVGRIIKEAPLYLRETGFLMMVLSRGEEKAVSLAKQVFEKVLVVKRKKGYTVLKLSRLL